MRQNKILIISGGSSNLTLVKNRYESNAYEVVIAVDAGLEVADALEIRVDYIVGDFDTVRQDVIEKYKKLANLSEKGYPKILRFRPEKDDTDTEIAMKKALELNPSVIDLVGATGTRLDHTIANIHLLVFALEQGVKAHIYDEYNKIYLLQDKIVLKKATTYGKYVSLLPLTDKVSDVTLTGFKYSLTKRDITIGSSLCISNEIVEEEATVEFDAGRFIVIESSDDRK